MERRWRILSIIKNRKTSVKTFLKKLTHSLAWLAVGAGGSLATPAFATAFPGPDGFGYTGAAIPFDLRNIGATGTSAFGRFVDDSVTGAKPIGFSFSFYGASYTDAYIGSNGFITFSPGQNAGCCSGGPLPGTANPSNLVAVWFTDLISAGNGTSDIFYQTLGTPGSREFVVQYLNNAYYSGGGTNTVEIVLHESTNSIELQYAATSANGHNRSAGIENLGGTVGLELVNDSTTLFNQQGYCISGNASCSAPSAVPEPGTLALLLPACAGLLGFGRRKKHAA